MYSIIDKGKAPTGKKRNRRFKSIRTNNEIWPKAFWMSGKYLFCSVVNRGPPCSPNRVRGLFQVVFPQTKLGRSKSCIGRFWNDAIQVSMLVAFKTEMKLLTVCYPRVNVYIDVENPWVFNPENDHKWSTNRGAPFSNKTQTCRHDIFPSFNKHCHWKKTLWKR